MYLILINRFITHKNHDKLISVLLYVEFPQVHCIDLSKIAQFVKAEIIVISVHSKLLTFFVVSQVSSAKVSPEWRLHLGFGTLKKCPFPLNRGVHSIEVTNTKTMGTFFRDLILCPLNGGIP